jgi:hypothetical protein
MHFAIHGLTARIQKVLAECRFVWKLPLTVLFQEWTKHMEFVPWNICGHHRTAHVIEQLISNSRFVLHLTQKYLLFGTLQLFVFCMKSTSGVMLQLRHHRAYYFLVTHLTNYKFAISCKGDIYRHPRFQFWRKRRSNGSHQKSSELSVSHPRIGFIGLLLKPHNCSQRTKFHPPEPGWVE